jgi:hypothetical protein
MRANISLALTKGAIMPETTTDIEKESLRKRIIYILLINFIIIEDGLVIIALVSHEWGVAIVAFVPISTLTLTSIASLFGQKRILDSLVDIMKELLRFGIRK